MLIQHKKEEMRGRFYIEEANKRLAELDYSLSSGVMAILHTEVDEKLKGKNIGYKLVTQAADYARENGLKIIPVCPFAHALFEKKKAEFTDVAFN